MTAHEVSLRRAITNLVDNAIKFTNTTIDISAKLVGHELVITVSDNGIGIEQENLEHHFGTACIKRNNLGTRNPTTVSALACTL